MWCRRSNFTLVQGEVGARDYINPTILPSTNPKEKKKKNPGHAPHSSPRARHLPVSFPAPAPSALRPPPPLCRRRPPCAAGPTPPRPAPCDSRSPAPPPPPLPRWLADNRPGPSYLPATLPGRPPRLHTGRAGGPHPLCAGRLGTASAPGGRIPSTPGAPGSRIPSAPAGSEQGARRLGARRPPRPHPLRGHIHLRHRLSSYVP
ncbi:hypothetical protein E2562_032288 [Oryza meyeriana var. granulata]|uniref:Uncharacterized protein n=1 Tax=Oryza meyeriana var. granulata TaxID=110450 RepID=A0A6G1F0I8_9ORYZ|nr:hypothetical protein E2562_032288 [Oryza meyeriana var. granulata]